jgi:hypothetical protein
MWHINMMVMQLYWGYEDGNFSSLEFKASSDVGFVKGVITTKNFVFCNLSYATKKCCMQLHMLHATPK